MARRRKKMDWGPVAVVGVLLAGAVGFFVMSGMGKGGDDSSGGGNGNKGNGAGDVLKGVGEFIFKGEDGKGLWKNIFGGKK